MILNGKNKISEKEFKAHLVPNLWGKFQLAELANDQ